MENPAPFDLNNALQRWRENLAASPAFRAENLDELEAHLRDSVSALVMKGLSAEEAWWVATHRLGKADLLREEFSRTNAEQVWLDRAIWMMAGFLLIECFKGSATVFASLVAAAGGHIRLSPQAGGSLMVLAHSAALLGMLVLLWKFVTRSPDQMTRITKWCAKYPVGIGFAVLLTFVLKFIVAPASTVLVRRLISPADLQIELMWYYSLSIPFDLLWTALLAWLLWRRSRNNEFSS